MGSNFRRSLFKICFGLSLTLTCSSVALAQRIISGSVTDDTDQALPGVYVLVKGTSNGTVTDIDGGYSIEVANNTDILVFQMLGMEPQEIVVGNQSIINAKLTASYSDMNEVVIVGYGVQKKVNLTGSVASVDMSDVAASRSITSLSSGLSGLAACLSQMNALFLLFSRSI